MLVAINADEKDFFAGFDAGADSAEDCLSGSTEQGAARRSPTAHVCLLISQNYSLFIFQYL
jgi:hypothetical protein